MSAPSSVQVAESSLPRTTRELLSELDALMERMLSLPVEESPLEESEPPPRGVTLTFVDTLAPPSTVTATLEPIPEEAADWTHRLFHLPAPEPVPVEEPILLFEAAAPPRVKDNAPAPIPEPHPAVAKAPTVARTPSVRSRRPIAIVPLPPRSNGWGYRVAVRFERGYRRTTGWFGPLGSMLRSGVGRSLLGLLGLAMLTTALGWIVRDLLRVAW